MGASKNDFMNDRETELYEPIRNNPFDQLTEKFEKEMHEYEDGNIDALETAVKMRKDYERLEVQMNLRKAWLDENKESIESEASKYPEGFKGYKVVMQTRPSYDFKNIDEWKVLEKAKKDFEAKSKAALLMVQKGGLNVDADGAEIPLPEVKNTSFLKFDKTK